MKAQLLQQASVLDIDEQIELTEAIWTGIVSRGLVPSLTQAQKSELDRRLADHLANPDDVIAWDDVKAAALAKLSAPSPQTPLALSPLNLPTKPAKSPASSASRTSCIRFK
jgi:putative addiction module component (TIGR02574 family)